MLSTITKKNEKDWSPLKVRVSKSMRDFSNHEYFVKKAEAAKKNLDKWGVPPELTAGRH